MTLKVQNQQKPAEPTLTKKPSEEPGLPQTSFSDHIAELRRRIFFVMLAFLVASSLAYNYRDQLLAAIMSPLSGEKLIYLTPGGGFNFIFQISLYAGLIAAAPVLIYQLYGFIRPALPTRAQRSSIVVVLVAFLLMLCGVTFGYFVAVPSALHFLSNFAGVNVSPSLTADSYLSFFLAYIAGLGVLFELPLLLLFLHWIHPMTPGKLLKSERFVILFAFVAAAIITPTPDMFNQAMIALPLILIYQLGVIAVLFAIHRDRRRAKKAQPAVVQEIPISPMEQVMQKLETSTNQPSLSVAAQPQPQPPASTSPQQRPAIRPQTVDGFTRYPRQANLQPPRRLTPPPRQNLPPTRSRYAERPNYRRSLTIDGFPIANTN
jgi:sec-independent protein translocase protein TatC